MSWIELNLPYSVYSYRQDRKYPKMPNLNHRAKKQLGMTIKENEKTLLSDNETDFINGVIFTEYYNEACNIENKLEKKKNLSYEDFIIEKNKKLQALAKHNKNIKKVLDYYDFKNRYEIWLEQQPEWVAYLEECNKIDEEYDNKIKSMSFVGLGLNQPGTLIEIDENGVSTQYLIGDINKLRGVCDDCVAFRESAIVKRYKVIWREE